MDTTTLVLIIGGVVVALAVAGVVVYLRSRPPREEPYYHVRCPGCKRRLRYRQRQVGNKGNCRNCGHAITFPPISQSVD
jgi:rRNA maturation endonuclease Nob1